MRKRVAFLRRFKPFSFIPIIILFLSNGMNEKGQDMPFFFNLDTFEDTINKLNPRKKFTSFRL